MNQLLENLTVAFPVLCILIGSFFGLLALSGLIGYPIAKWIEKKGWM